MNISPQLRLSIALVTLLLSTVLVADMLGLLPRPETQIRNSRKTMAESLAVQLSSAASNGGEQSIQTTIEEIVRRNDEVRYAALLLADGREVGSFGDLQSTNGSADERSDDEALIVPIFQGSTEWGEVRLRFAPAADWGLRYLGFSLTTLSFLLFICISCLVTFYLFMRKALTELNPSKVVPQRVMAAFDVLAEGVLIVDEKERIVLANQSIAQRMGEEPLNMVGKSPSAYAWDLKGDDLEELPWQTVLKYGEHVTGMPLKVNVENEETSFTVNAAPIDDGQGVRKGVLITFDDVTPIEVKNAELANMLAELSATQRIIEDKNRQLELLATRDPLTNCLNRRSFLEAYREQFDKATRKHAPLSLMMVDIDYFKRVNDNHGHLIGDQAINLVARILKNRFDRLGSVGRYGGEEFIVSIPDVELKECLDLAEAFRRSVRQGAEMGDLPIGTLTVSIGAASLSRDVKDEIQLLDQADRALYQAKETGRNRVCKFDSSYSNVRENASKGRDAFETTQKRYMRDLHSLRAKLESMQELVSRQAKEIVRKSLHDELTGLPNRFLLQDRLAQAMKLSNRNGTITAVVCISLSSYRKIYHLAGHEVAEESIREAARSVESVVRSVDSIGIAYNDRALTFSRIAENELAMLVVDLDSVESVAKIVGRVTKALERQSLIGGHEVINQVYCGVALYPHDGKEPEVLVRNASLARRYAERRSPHYSDNAYYSRDIDILATKNAGIAAELHKAMEKDGLSVVYQPKVDPVSNRLTGCEALARWDHPEFGNVSPDEFIAVAENIGMVDQLTNWVLSRVCDDIATGVFGDMRVSVNVSPLELHDPTTADRLLGIIRAKGVLPTQLEVEITESSILNNFELAREILTKLRSEGLLIVLDDFGTAYSSLNLLLKIPVDVVKVDRSFVQNVQDAPDNRAVVNAIIQMASAMGKRVVAEGVETVQERDCLISLGCEEIQGYLFSKPLRLESLGSFIARYGVLGNPRVAQRIAMGRSA